MYRKQYRVAQIFLGVGMLLMVGNLAVTYLAKSRMLPMWIPLALSLTITAAALIICVIGLVLYASLLWFIRRFTDITPCSAGCLIASHAVSFVCFTMLQINWIFSIRLPYALPLLLSIIYRHVSGGSKIDHSLQELCSEFDKQLVSIGLKQAEEELQSSNEL